LIRVLVVCKKDNITPNIFYLILLPILEPHINKKNEEKRKYKKIKKTMLEENKIKI
jgi:hypothetical protein